MNVAAAKRTNAIGFSNNALKIIAMVTMLIDHVGMELLPEVELLRYIGRISFPIFAYMISEGCRYTRNRKKYLGIIFALGVAFQIVYYVVSQSLYQRILIAFSLSISIIYCIDALIKNEKRIYRALALLGLLAIATVLFVFPVMFKKWGFEIDYGALGVLLPVAVYYAKGKWQKLLVATLMLCAMALLFGTPRSWFALLAIPILMLYNQKRGKANLKYMFYIFYPAHLVIIYAISYFLQG